jgi:hypothetical protein
LTIPSYWLHPENYTELILSSRYHLEIDTIWYLHIHMHFWDTWHFTARRIDANWDYFHSWLLIYHSLTSSARDSPWREKPLQLLYSWIAKRRTRYQFISSSLAKEFLLMSECNLLLAIEKHICETVRSWIDHLSTFSQCPLVETKFRILFTSSYRVRILGQNRRPIAIPWFPCKMQHLRTSPPFAAVAPGSRSAICKHVYIFPTEFIWFVPFLNLSLDKKKDKILTLYLM